MPKPTSSEPEQKSEPSWFAKFFAGLDPKWVATMLVALIGVGGAAQNQAKIEETSEVVEDVGEQVSAVQDSHNVRIDSLVVALAASNRRVARLEKLLAQKKAPVPGTTRKRTIKREPKATGRGTLLASLRKLWPFG